MVQTPPDVPAFTIEPQGAFSLEALATLGFHATDLLCRRAPAAEVGQDHLGVHTTRHGDVEVDVARTQVARVLSLDHDGNRFADVGRSGGRKPRAAPFRRPITGSRRKRQPGR